jgi:glycerol uptake facilitator protein
LLDIDGLNGQTLVEQLRADEALVPEGSAIMAEVVGTFLLALVVFALTDSRNGVSTAVAAVPAIIGMTVAALICVIAPLTQACFNPARDFGPRLFAFLAGWGSVALPGPRPTGFLTVYILAPIAGALLAGGFYCRILRPTAETPQGEAS